MFCALLCAVFAARCLADEEEYIAKAALAQAYIAPGLGVSCNKQQQTAGLAVAVAACWLARTLIGEKVGMSCSHRSLAPSLALSLSFHSALYCCLFKFLCVPV